jgi:hypothetical protein
VSDIPNTGDPPDVMNWAMTYGVDGITDRLHSKRVAALADTIESLRAQLAEAEAREEKAFKAGYEVGSTQGDPFVDRITEDDAWLAYRAGGGGEKPCGT